jgi:hypothetical protein
MKCDKCGHDESIVDGGKGYFTLTCNNCNNTWVLTQVEEQRAGEEEYKPIHDFLSIYSLQDLKDKKRLDELEKLCCDFFITFLDTHDALQSDTWYSFKCMDKNTCGLKTVSSIKTIQSISIYGTYIHVIFYDTGVIWELREN